MLVRDDLALVVVSEHCIGSSTVIRRTIVIQRVIHILLLDDYHAGDVLFVQSLSRSLARMKRRRVVLVHGSGEHAERALEAEGIFKSRENGVLPVESAREHTIVERAVRHVNRKICDILTDAVVPTVGVIGSERGLFRVQDGRIEAQKTEWLETLIRQEVVPVVAAHAIDAGSGGTGEIPLQLALDALIRSFDGDSLAVVFTKTNLPGVMKGGEPEPSISMDGLSEHVLPDVDVVAHLVSRHVSVLLTNTTRLSDADGPLGTLIRTPT